MMGVPKLVVIADDLTGAADSAARCVNAGLSAEVWVDSSLLQADVPAPTDADVVALSTDSRFLPPNEAAQRVDVMVSRLAGWGATTWYKKIDSTLRGNLGAELDAMLGVMSDRAAVICPAFPTQGRGLEGGKLVYAGGEPRHLPTLLGEQSQRPIATIDLDVVRLGAAELQRALVEKRQQGALLLVVDALTDADLEVIVAATMSSDARATGGYLLCGSAGLVGPLSARVAAQEVIAGVEAGALVARGPILALVGSGSAMAHAQIAAVVAADVMRVRVLDEDWYQLDLIGVQSQPVGDWLIHLAPPDADVPLEGAVARAQAARLADLAFAAVERLQPGTLFVVGGDTAYYVLRRLGIARLAVVEELLPGIALTFGVDRAGVCRAVVLKPGNFGDAQTLVTLQEAVHRRRGCHDT